MRCPCTSVGAPASLRDGLFPLGGGHLRAALLSFTDLPVHIHKVNCSSVMQNGGRQSRLRLSKRALSSRVFGLAVDKGMGVELT